MNEKMMPTKLQIELPESIAEGVYSNLVIIVHSNSEFIFDFVRMVPGIAKAKVQSRVIMTPVNAKSMLKSLSENIEKYEQTFGEIKLVDNKNEKLIGFPNE